MRSVLVSGLWSIGLLIGCGHPPAARAPAALPLQPTALHYTGQSYVLLRHGQPYFIQGAGYQTDGPNRMARLRACGGNSIRIWDETEAEPVLAQAQGQGLTVLFGLWVERETDGFDYDDQIAVDKQFERLRKIVLKYRHHPALLMWCVGNEVVLFATNLRAYDEVSRLIAMIHQLDPDHPVTTALSMDSARTVWLLRERCPGLDVLSVNVYGDIARMHRFLKEGGWTGPYLISEFGAKGYWPGDAQMTPWNTPIEPTSQQKREFVRLNYEQYIGSRPANGLGAYLFFWGNKQEETHTWFSFFDEQNRETPLVGLMQSLWSKRVPDNQAPVVAQVFADGRATTSVTFNASSAIHQAQVVATDPDGDSLSYAWEIRASASRTQLSAYQDVPMPILDGLIDVADAAQVRFRLPPRPGAYRLFVTIYDTHRHVATANLSFRVASVDALP